MTKRSLVFLVILFAGATALNADVIYSVSVDAPSLGPNAVVTASATLPTFIDALQFAFPPDSSTFSNATEVASVTFFALAGIDWLPNAFVQFPFLLYTDPQGDFHDLTFNDSNVTSFNCNDGAPCDASTSLRYLDSNITAGFGTVGMVEADFTITSTAVPEPGTFGLLAISLLALIVLAISSPAKTARFNRHHGHASSQA